MRELFFFATIITLLVLLVRLLIRAARRKPLARTSKLLLIIIGGYGAVWLLFYFISADVIVPFGTERCFDDWCATVSHAESLPVLGPGAQPVKARGRFIILDVKMSNHARGIAQKPSEPRIHIIDKNGHYWSPSPEGQQALEMEKGPLTDLGARLGLHESATTKIVFDLPANAKGLMALIEEGPAITNLLWPGEKEIFPVPDQP